MREYKGNKYNIERLFRFNVVKLHLHLDILAPLNHPGHYLTRSRCFLSLKWEKGEDDVNVNPLDLSEKLQAQWSHQTITISAMTGA